MRNYDEDVLVVGWCAGCGLESTEESARAMGLPVTRVVTVNEALSMGGSWTCVTCGYRMSANGARSTPAKRQYPQRKKPRKTRKRVPVIRSLSGNGVSYRFFGESYGMSKAGVNVAAIEGFKGTGVELAKKLNMPPADLATALHLSLEELMKTSFDVSKD